MCKPCSIFIIACGFCFNLDSAWQTKGILSLPIPRETKPPAWQAQGPRTRSTPPPTTPTTTKSRLRPEPLWPLPPPGEDIDRLLAERMKTYTPWPTTVKRTRTSRTPNPPHPELRQEPIWPLPPPDEDYDRLLAERINSRMARIPDGQGVNAFIPHDNLPFWKRQDPRPVRRAAKKKHKSLLKKANESTRLAPYQLLQDDTTTKRATGKTESDLKIDGDFNQYSMKDDLEIMLREIDEANVTVEVLTRTVEYNDIVICKITQSKLQSRYFRAAEDKYMDEEPDKKIIFIVHGLSAMGFTIIPALNEKKSFMKLLKYYTAHLDKFDIFLVPMANPDGVGDETLENWNKNKSPQSACLGVALDRNFDVSWNASNSNSCNQQYPGPSPFSELESRAIGDVLHYYSHKIIAYIHVHGGTYDPSVFKGDAVLYPKGFTEVATEDDKYIDIKGEIDEAIRNAGFKVMSVSMDTLYNWYGKVHGSSVDFASTIYGVPYALEFVMQPYEDNVRAEHSDERVSDNVLTEIWKRVVDVVFTNIYKNTHANDVK